MQISFIVTTFNIDPYIRQCLDSLKACTRPGDQIVIIDDNSTDRTPSIIDAFIQENQGMGVEFTAAHLGVNTIGGVGIPANIGMDMSTRDVIFFVDGDDFLEVENFHRARRIYERSGADIAFCNYLEHDEKNNAKKNPADAGKWSDINPLWSLDEARTKALDLIAVPWRKFYRASFLREHRIRFPEGNYFFEDNPFHWRVCRLAKSITFINQIVCHHRVNRPGQTMTSTGDELSAFFTHFETIFTEIAPENTEQRVLSARWLVNNMTWHLDRLQPGAVWAYIERAARVLPTIPADIWNGPLAESFVGKTIWPIVHRLREGHTWDVYELLTARKRHSQLEGLLKSVSAELKHIRSDVKSAAGNAKKSRELLQAQQYIDEFTALMDFEANQYPGGRS
ncbi:glycosyltransferase family 2 protein [Falsirhodobacter halotolerans]|uniref:glycosyltransferase family 2 protein n=1 Tax=Falsirhodobacter halotolerans TaxID=1146892 RepID=UPI001FD2B172|nr:glycosyltransferase family 2 protein [Falsirhodobacter halotolerans]MCJ8139625.1 glycosyltransferase family 2 protein [Falsirhodobacter halotolerans]